MAANPNNFGCSFYCYVKMLIGKILLSCIKRKLKSSKIGIIAGKQKDFNWWLDSPNPPQNLPSPRPRGWLLAVMTLSRSPQYRTMLPQRETHLSSLAAMVGGDRGEVWVSRGAATLTIATIATIAAAHTPTRQHFLGHFPASMCQRTYRRLTITEVLCKKQFCIPSL